MGRRYLLTYNTEVCISGMPQYTIQTYEWFNDEEEMEYFIRENNVIPIEKLYIESVQAL